MLGRAGTELETNPTESSVFGVDSVETKVMGCLRGDSNQVREGGQKQQDGDVET